MIKEAIILAGGLGTRLRSVVSDLPKCMAPVGGQPFLHYVIDHFKKQGISQFIFSLGYKHELISDWLESNMDKGTWKKMVEDEPLGTGGAIKLACTMATTENVLVLNGDTLFPIYLEELSTLHESNEAICTLSLKPMHKIDRYGVVELEGERIRSFKEKQYYELGLINGGVYALNVPDFLEEQLPVKFSFEKDYLEQYVSQRKMLGLVQDAYFIDIGIPEDYERAQKELAK